MAVRICSFKRPALPKATTRAYCLLPYCLLPYCLLPTAYCLLLTAYCLLLTAYCLLLRDAHIEQNPKTG
jgi:hypothetical protein